MHFLPWSKHMAKKKSAKKSSSSSRKGAKKKGSKTIAGRVGAMVKSAEKGVKAAARYVTGKKAPKRKK
jgi:hypothetical protein